MKEIHKYSSKQLLFTDKFQLNFVVLDNFYTQMIYVVRIYHDCQDQE